MSTRCDAEISQHWLVERPLICKTLFLSCLCSSTLRPEPNRPLSLRNIAGRCVFCLRPYMQGAGPLETRSAASCKSPLNTELSKMTFRAFRIPGLHLLTSRTIPAYVRHPANTRQRLLEVQHRRVPNHFVGDPSQLHDSPSAIPFPSTPVQVNLKFVRPLSPGAADPTRPLSRFYRSEVPYDMSSPLRSKHSRCRPG